MKSLSIKMYLQLLEIFTIREIKSRYKASILGPIWIVLHPLSTAIILNFIFGTFIRVSTEEVPYFLFILSALIFWNFFQQGVLLAKDALVWNRDLITKTSFSKDVLPLSYILSKIPDFFIYLLIFSIFYLSYSNKIYLKHTLIIISIIPLFLFSAGVSLIVSVANAIFRDFGRLVEFLLMILFYITPIVYSDLAVPEKYRLFLLINPLSLLIIFTRNLLFKNISRYDMLLMSFISGLFIFIVGIAIFKKYNKKIVDLI